MTMIDKLKEMAEGWGGQLLPYDEKTCKNDPKILDRPYSCGHTYINWVDWVVYYDPKFVDNIEHILAVIHCMGEVFACNEFGGQDPSNYLAWEYYVALQIGVTAWWSNQDWETEDGTALKDMPAKDRKAFLGKMVLKGVEYGNLEDAEEDTDGLDRVALCVRSDYEGEDAEDDDELEVQFYLDCVLIEDRPLVPGLGLNQMAAEMARAAVPPSHRSGPFLSREAAENAAGRALGSGAFLTVTIHTEVVED